VTTETGALWLTIVNPAVFMTWCAECGDKLVKGGKVQRIDGGYGYRCERHRVNDSAPTGAVQEDGGS
jgi:hypothetical protein